MVNTPQCSNRMRAVAELVISAATRCMLLAIGEQEGMDDFQ